MTAQEQANLDTLVKAAWAAWVFVPPSQPEHGQLRRALEPYRDKQLAPLRKEATP